MPGPPIRSDSDGTVIRDGNGSGVYTGGDHGGAGEGSVGVGDGADGGDDGGGVIAVMIMMVVVVLVTAGGQRWRQC